MSRNIEELTQLLDAVVDADISAHARPEVKQLAERNLAIWTQNNRFAIIASLKWQRLADRAISLVEDAIKDTEWGQPTFGPDYGEELRAEYAVLLNEGGSSDELLGALEFLANVARATPGFPSPMALQQADRAIAKARGTP